MILSTHAVIGTAIAALFPGHPELAFGFAFASHFATDAIPHLEYRLYSLYRNPRDEMKNEIMMDTRFLKDLSRIGVDVSLGLLLSLLTASLLNAPLIPTVILGTGGGLLPDFLQFVYWHSRHEPIRSLQCFHVWIHTKKHLRESPFFGIVSQIALALGVVCLAKILLTVTGRF